MDSDRSLPASDIAERVRRAMDRLARQGEPSETAGLAAHLFEQFFHARPEATAGASVYVPLIAEHTHYFEGFGLLIRTQAHAAVALRPNEGEGRVVATGVDDESVRVLLEALAPTPNEHFDAAIHCTVSSAGAEAELAALGVALGRAIGRSDQDIATSVAKVLTSLFGRPIGSSSVLASLDGGEVVLVDAAVYEHLDIGRPENLGAAIVGVGPESLPSASHFQRLAADIERSLKRLREAGFADLKSLRQLEHRDLPQALGVIESSRRPLLRHLVTEDRRVGRVVAGLRREDAQIVGALLLMSHASRRDDLNASSEEAEFVVARAEAAEGVYGARLAGPGYGGRVLVVGRPFLLPNVVDALAEAYLQRFGQAPPVTIL